MRFIGNLPSEETATRFSNVLLALGIDHQVEKDADRWALWVSSEEDVARASEKLGEFLRHPASREFEAPAREGAVRRRMLSEDAVEGGVSGREAVNQVLPHGVGALTAVLTAVCLAITCACWAGYSDRVFGELLITRMSAVGWKVSWDSSLPEIFKQGEFWRLITPALVHFNAVHLLMNLLWLIALGSAIEGCQGTGRLGLLFLTIGAGSNLAQNFLGGPAFCGVSGVLYGLLGYIWMKGKFDPESGLALHPYTLVLMLVFLFLGMGGAFTVLFGISVGNGAHAAGLILGVLWGLVTSLPEIRRRRRAGRGQE